MVEKRGAIVAWSIGRVTAGMQVSERDSSGQRTRSVMQGTQLEES
jgi:hypothetical protein